MATITFCSAEEQFNLGLSDAQRAEVDNWYNQLAPNGAKVMTAATIAPSAAAEDVAAGNALLRSMDAFENGAGVKGPYMDKQEFENAAQTAFSTPAKQALIATAEQQIAAFQNATTKVSTAQSQLQDRTNQVKADVDSASSAAKLKHTLIGGAIGVAPGVAGGIAILAAYACPVAAIPVFGWILFGLAIVAGIALGAFIGNETTHKTTDDDYQKAIAADAQISKLTEELNSTKTTVGDVRRMEVSALTNLLTGLTAPSPKCGVATPQ